MDLAERLLELARVKASRLGLANLQIRHGDIEDLDYPPGRFDAVVIVFGIFFLPDMHAATRRLWDWVSPGGRLAVTTWGPRLWEPASSLFWHAVADVRPDLYRACNPWASVSDPGEVTDLLTRAGAADVGVEPVAAEHPLRRTEDFWTIVLGSGLRATHDKPRVDNGRMMRHVRPDRPAVITTAPESLTRELDRRQRRYTAMAAIFIATFTAAALLHRDTALALLLCGIAMTTLVVAVIGANIRSPRRRPDGLGRLAHEQPQLRSAPVKHPPAS